MNLSTPPITATHWSEYHETNPMELIVCCVYWGTKYSTRYVYHLRDMVARNLTLNHRFVCISDVDLPGIDCIPIFALSWRGWWQKVSLFMPSLFPSGARILYLDLDVVIIGELNTLAKQVTDQPLTMIYNFGPNRGQAAHNSSVMLWTAGDTRLNSIHDFFTEDVMMKLHGDQCWIWRVLQDKIANWPQRYIKSYKYDVSGKTPDRLTRIVVFHGNPKPSQCKEAWVKINWG